MNITQKVKEFNEFKEFNPMQRKALEKDWKNKNLVISSPTASGKTIVAELCALNSVINNKKKVIYTCPLRALASEHCNDFKKKYSKKLKIRTTISTGDFDSSSRYLSNYDLIYTTYEKLDSLIRHRADWLNYIGLLVVDEIHSIDSDRGPCLEMIITKLRQMNPELQILALSATIPNAKELAKWLDAELVLSNYRPVKLIEGVYFNGIFDYGEGKEQIEKEKDGVTSIIVDTLDKQKQALVFANTRKRSEGIAKKLTPIIEKNLSQREIRHLEREAERVLNVLENPTEQCRTLSSLIKRGVCFHNAGLMQKQREIIENLFRENYLKVIAATPTLAAGVNLPAFRVIIPSLYRYTIFGNQRISVGEYKQMCLPYNAKIFTKERGNIKIGEIVERRLPFNVLSFNTERFELEFKPITNYFKRESRDLVGLTFESGRSLTLTPNHPVLVSKSNSHRWGAAKKIIKGEKVLCLKKFPKIKYALPYFFKQFPKSEAYVVNRGSLFTKTKKFLNLTEKKLAKKIGINPKRIYHMKKNHKAMPISIAMKLCDLLGYSDKRRAELFKYIKSRYGNVLKVPPKPTTDFLWLVGFIATDGNLNRTIDRRTNSAYITIRVFNTNNRLIKKAEQCFSDFGIYTYKSKRPDGLITLEAGATLLAKVLKNHYGLKYSNKTSTVEIPNFLEKSSPEFIGAYLGGVFDGDGNFNIAKQKRGKESKVYRILFATGSIKFALGLQKLLGRIGIISNIKKEKKDLKVMLKGREVVFSKPRYSVIFRKIEYIKAFSKFAKIYKTKIDVEYSNYHNVNKRDKSNLDYEWLHVVKIKKIKSKETVYNISVEENENYFADKFLVHNCGRAGRPKYDSRGEAILLAKSEIEKEELFDFYINGEIEEVNSQLGIEPILRTHILASIANNFVYDLASMEEFFSKTFYAQQYKGIEELFGKITEILQQLKEMEFIEGDEKTIKATKLGNRISELYLDPASAHNIIFALKKNQFNELFYLYMLSNTFEFYPLVSVPKKKEAELWEGLQQEKNSLPIDVDREMFSDPDILRKFNTALMLQDWIEEVSEENIMKDFNIQPGILHARLQIADWLTYASFELARLLELQSHFTPLNRLRKRLKSGIREELIYLCEVRGIGRVRARRLWRSNVRTITDLKKIDVMDLSRILGEGVARNIKKVLGQ